MGVLDPYFVAARMAAKYKLTERQEHVLSVILAGLPDEAAIRFSYKRGAKREPNETRFAILNAMAWYDRKWCEWITHREQKKRAPELRRAMGREIDRKAKRKKG